MSFHYFFDVVVKVQRIFGESRSGRGVRRMPASANALSGDSGEIVLDDVPVSSSNENDVCVSQNSALHFKCAFFPSLIVLDA